MECFACRVLLRRSNTFSGLDMLSELHMTSPSVYDVFIVEMTLLIVNSRLFEIPVSIRKYDTARVIQIADFFIRPVRGTQTVFGEGDQAPKLSLWGSNRAIGRTSKGSHLLDLQADCWIRPLWKRGSIERKSTSRTWSNTSKGEPRGKRRLHKKPNATEGCLPAMARCGDCRPSS